MATIAFQNDIQMRKLQLFIGEKLRESFCRLKELFSDVKVSFVFHNFKMIGVINETDVGFRKEPKRADDSGLPGVMVNRDEDISGVFIFEVLQLSSTRKMLRWKIIENAGKKQGSMLYLLFVQTVDIQVVAQNPSQTGNLIAFDNVCTGCIENYSLFGQISYSLCGGIEIQQASALLDVE